jgi:hypothetical protein
MTDTVRPFPTADRSDTIIAREIERDVGRPDAKPGHLCIFCVDAEEDLWTVWLVDGVDSRGIVATVASEAGEALALSGLLALDVYFANDPAPFEPEKLRELMLWKQHRGLAAVQAAGRAAWRPDYPRDGR